MPQRSTNISSPKRIKRAFRSAWRAGWFLASPPCPVPSPLIAPHTAIDPARVKNLPDILPAVKRRYDHIDLRVRSLAEAREHKKRGRESLIFAGTILRGAACGGLSQDLLCHA